MLRRWPVEAAALTTCWPITVHLGWLETQKVHTGMGQNCVGEVLDGYINTSIRIIYIYTYIYIYYNDKTQIVSWILTFNPSHTTGNPHPASPNPPALPAATDPSCPAPAPCPASPCSHPSHQPESWSCPRATKPWPGRNRDLLGLRWFFHVFPTNYSDVWWFMASVSDVSSSW